MSILDTFGMDLHYAKKVGWNSPYYNLIFRCEALIDLVRKKDKALKELLNIKDQPWDPDQYLHEYIKEALALTEELK